MTLLCCQLTNTKLEDSKSAEFGNQLNQLSWAINSSKPTQWESYTRRQTHSSSLFLSLAFLILQCSWASKPWDGAPWAFSLKLHMSHCTDQTTPSPNSNQGTARAMQGDFTWKLVPCSAMKPLFSPSPITATPLLVLYNHVADFSKGLLKSA